VEEFAMSWFPRLFVLLAGALLAAPARAAPPAKTETAYFAGGCYWGMEAVFEHVKGVESVVAGHAWGQEALPPGGQRRPGHDGAAEAVQVTFDPAQISYAQLLQIYFTVAHDPTQLDRQGPDQGTEYRSSLFVTAPAQLQAAQAQLQALGKVASPRHPVVTDLVRFDRFRPVPEDQQNFAAKHPDLPYIVINDHPKVEHLKKSFPALYKG
jgi:peptide-methionine (S)-S-oxide reductase